MQFFKRKSNFFFLLIAFLLIESGGIYGQSVGIGTKSPNPNAALEVVSSGKNQGLLLPRLTSTERLSMDLGVSDIGLLVFDTVESTLYFWNGNAWVSSASTGPEVVTELSFSPVTSELAVIGGNAVDLSSLQNDDSNEIIESLSLQSNELVIDEAGNNWKQDLTALSMQGDVDGTLGTTRTRGLQGIPIDASAPQAGDHLVFNGTRWAATPEAGDKISYYSVGAADFVPLYQNESAVDKTNALIFASNNSFVTLRSNSEGIFLMAQLHLPHGAEITKVSIYYFDNHGPNMQFRLVEQQMGGGSVLLNVANSSENPPNLAQRDLTGNYTVDNSVNSYVLLAELNVLNETKNPGVDADQGVYGAIVEYILP